MPTDTPKPQPTNAPWLSVPNGKTISVEHPCIIKNIDKAVDMIGGASAISQALEDDSDKTFALSFRPGDPAARTIIANKKHANNVLLQISVPRRTGRKRKRGSSGPWIEDTTVETPKRDATYMVRSMADNGSKYKVTALSGISSMHLWRSMPDFSYSTSQLKVLEDVKSKLLSQHYPTIKEFELPQTHGLQDTTTLPPPTWSNQSIPQNYTYRQNPNIKVVSDPTTGKRVLRNTQAAPKIYSYQVQWDTPEYPSAPMPGIPPLAEQSNTFKTTVAAIDVLFQERPIWTRRALLNRLESHLSSFNVVRFCIAYVAYAVRSGPWRDAYIRLGVDPRTDPKYRYYQSIMLQLVPKNNQGALAPAATARKPHGETDKDNEPAAEGLNTTVRRPSKDTVLENRHTYARFWARSNDPTSHIFDGVSPLPPDGKVWQLCDITDPQLAALRDVSKVYIRAVCENRYFGWYPNGTAAKIRVALKAKADALQSGKSLDPSLLEEFLQLPERLGSDTDTLGTDDQIKALTTTEPNDQLKALAVEPSPHRQAQIAHTLSSRNEELSIFLGEDATKQQQIWAASYRAFARTEPGMKSAMAGQAHAQLTKSKPVLRKSSRGSKGGTGSGARQPTEGDENMQDASGSNQEQPIDVDQEEQPGPDVYEEDLEIEDTEEILPSIEINGFDVDDEDDLELGLDIDPEIKLEEDDVTEGLSLEHSYGPAESINRQKEVDETVQT